MTAVLTIEDLGTGGRWRDVRLPEWLEREYRNVTGWSEPATPIGLAPVVARLAYTDGRSMPPGGVLRQISLTPLGNPPSDGPWEARIRAGVLGVRADRRRVAIDCDLRSADGDIAAVRFELDWPVGAA
jgi:hypothetical protein